MAKDRFYRTKPHVNVSTVRWLTRRGVSPLGVHQITHGLVVTNPTDRIRLAEAIAEAKGEGKEYVYHTVTLTN